MKHKLFLLLLWLVLCVPAIQAQYISAQSHKQAAATAQTITADGAGTAVDVTGYSQVLFTVRGTYVVVSVAFEGSPDATNYFPVACARVDSAVNETSSGALTNTTRAWRCNVTGFTRFRHNSDWTSGTANVTITPVAAASDMGVTVSQATAANLNTTVTGTVSVNALPAGTNNIGDVDVLTLPSIPTGSNTIGGVNLVQYTPVSGRLPVDGSGVTQPVSGSVTANAGTNLNTSALALESGGNLATIAGAVRAEDAAHTSAHTGIMGLTVRQDTAAQLAGTDGDYAPLITDSSGRLHVNVGNTVNVASHNVTNAGTFAVQAAQSGTWTVQPGNTANTTAWLVTGTGGTFPATQSGTWNVNNVTGTVSLPTGAATESTLSALNSKINTEITADYDTGAGTQTMKYVGLALPASGGAVAGGTSTNPLRTDPTGITTQPVSGTVSVNALPTGNNTIGAVNLAQYTPASGRLPVDGSGVTQPISASSLPLPSGAATAAKQPALGTAGSASSDVITVQGIASMTALKVDGSAVTQPVSGTITANIGTAGSLALDASVTGLQVSQGSTTSGQKGSLVQGAVTTSAPSYTTAQTSPLSLTTAGGLRIDGSGVTQPISAASLPLPSGAATAAKQPALGTAGSASSDVISVQGIASMTALKVDGSAVTQPVSGTVSITTNSAVNVAQINGVAPTMGNGASGTGVQRVTIANDSTGQVALAAGSNTIGALTANQSVNLNQVAGSSIATGNGAASGSVRVTVANDSTGQIGLVPLTAGGLSISRTISAASTNATSVKGSAGQVYAIHVINTNAAVRYLKIYNKASSPTVGTDTPVLTFPIPASATGAGFVLSTEMGIAFGTGIAFAVTTGVADSDTGAVGANEIVINLLYK